jgi:hypothetical protein
MTASGGIGALVVGLFVVGSTVSCGLRTSENQDPNLQPLRQAEADLEGAIGVGVNYLDLGHRVQNLASAVVLAKQNGTRADLVRPYENALEMYMDSLALWKLKLQCPSAFRDQFPTCSVTPEIEALAARYSVPFDRNAALDPATEKLLRTIAAMDTYSSRLTAAQVRDAHERKFESLRAGYEEQQSLSAGYNKLLTTIWRKAASSTAGSPSAARLPGR